MGHSFYLHGLLKRKNDKVEEFVSEQGIEDHDVTWIYEYEYLVVARSWVIACYIIWHYT